MPSRALRFAEITAVAVFAVLAATVVRVICHVAFNETIPYTPFYPAIVVATMYGRVPGGVLATILAAFAACFWIPPFGQLLIQESTDLIGLVLFLAVSGVLVWLCEQMQSAKEAAEHAATEERRALEREQQARHEAEEANRLKDQFLASASHELRTPLQAILGWAHLLMRGDMDGQDRSKALEIIERNAQVQSRLMEDLLDMGRIVSGKLRVSPRAIEPKQVIEAAIQAVTTAAQAKQIAIVRSYSGDQSTLWADPDRLQQVVWNLLSNSIKFSPPGSTVNVSLRREHQHVEIEVADEGEGVDPEFLPQMFERFRQADGSRSRRVQGLGLGLAIVKQLVELHGGTVQAESAGLGRGTSITVTLPIGTSPTDPAAPAVPQAGKGASRALRVLVVDDDGPTCDLIGRVLQQRHYQVVAANSVDAALQAMTGFDPDIIVSDIVMPERDGYDLLRQVRRRESRSQRRIPAMALTALSSPADKRRAFEAGYRLHLTKPVDPSALTEAIEELTSK